MKKTIAVLAGDGVGPEVINEAIKVLKKLSTKFRHQFVFKNALIGACAIDKTGSALPKETIAVCKSSDAILLGAVGDPKYDTNPAIKVRPEQGLLTLRKELGLYANLRPIFSFPIISLSPLRKEVTQNVDFVIVRELTGGLYFGKPRGRKNNDSTAFETNIYSKKEILRVAKVAFELAMKRHKKVTLVDKANVLETSRLWRETVMEYSKNFPDITLEYMYVDNAAMQIIKRPIMFDVILTDNIFGDILSDEASVIAGSIGLLPSASIGEKTALYEPIHGSFPKAKNTNRANPIGSILSAALMLKISFGLEEEAEAVEKAVAKTISQGFGTADIVSKNPLTTSELGDKIVSLI